jgi:SAM-dependent methyltransferase
MSFADDVWNRLSLSPRKRFARLLPSGAMVVDVGSGDMSKTYAFVYRVKRSLRIVGIEKYADATIYGHSPLPRRIVATGMMQRVACDFTEAPLPFEDFHFDGAYCSHVIEHVKDRGAVIAEIARVLRPHGILYVETPGPRSLAAPKASSLYTPSQTPINYYDDPTHVDAPMTVAQLRSLLEANGFGVLDAGLHRDFGVLGLPLYAALIAIGALPFVPFAMRWRLRAAGWWNLVGWPIFAIARKLPAGKRAQSEPLAVLPT